MLNVFVTAVLAFLFGMAVGIAGYFFTTIAAYEKEIEAIFDRVVAKYEKMLENKNRENRNLYDTVVDLQVKLEKAKKEERK